MGKKLIIKGADFSVNGIEKSALTWYTDLKALSEMTNQSFTPNFGTTGETKVKFTSYALNWGKIGLSDIYGKPINRLRFSNYSKGINMLTKKINNLIEHGVELAVYKIKLTVDWSSLAENGASSPWETTKDYVQITEVEKFSPNVLSAQNFDTNTQEAIYNMTNEVTLANDTEFISVGSPSMYGKGYLSENDCLLPYSALNVPVEALDEKPALYTGLEERGWGPFKTIHIPAIDLGYYSE